MYLLLSHSLSHYLLLYTIYLYIHLSLFIHLSTYFFYWVGVCANPGEQLRARQGRQRYHHPAGVRLLPGKLAVKTVTRQISCGCYPVIFGSYLLNNKGCSLNIVFFLKMLWFFWTLQVLLQRRWCLTCHCVHTHTEEKTERGQSPEF